MEEKKKGRVVEKVCTLFYGGEEKGFVFVVAMWEGARIGSRAFSAYLISRQSYGPTIFGKGRNVLECGFDLASGFRNRPIRMGENARID